MKTFPLVIITPFGKYFDSEVESVQVRSEDYNLGILPGHSPLISTLTISKAVITKDGNKVPYAIGGGIIRVTKEKVTLVLDSIERYDEIDIARAQSAKERAEERLRKIADDGHIDAQRAKLALTRALNRIRITEQDKN